MKYVMGAATWVAGRKSKNGRCSDCWTSDLLVRDSTGDDRCNRERNSNVPAWLRDTLDVADRRGSKLLVRRELASPLNG
jgi:hypothetical protein